ncbi:hypothetical protein [Fluviicola sp.]|uniref:hypothetical protein n=1 Tax=Fluviicola sp. TaxID=1917219 RepID=UPI0028328165|nr:hypothetical protein [Fluviicola sp.]MDR0803402.1 HlyD family secretion protein [Fluviicola sp.]
MTQEDEIHLELRSEPVNELLSEPPFWVIRSGSTLFLLVVGLLTGLTWFIRYPDEISGDVVVTSSKAPIELTNQGYVQLTALHVSENQEVEAGELLARFDIHAKPEDMAIAAAYLDQLEAFEGKFANEIPVCDPLLELGTFQEQWTLLLSQVSEWNSEHAGNLVEQKRASIQREIAFRKQLEVISGKKIKLSEGEYELLREQLSGSERLVEQHALSKQNLVQDKRTETQASQAIHVQKEQQVQNLIALNSLQQQLLELEHEQRARELEKSSEIRVRLSALRNGFQTWEKNGVWLAPCSGKVLFNKVLQVNRFYKANEASIVVVPEGSGYTMLAVITSEGAGKVRTGQKAFVELTDFPKAEFGVLEGKVVALTQIDKEGKYEVKMNLPKGLKTSYRKQLPFRVQLKGKVKIITKERRLLERLFEQLTSLTV